MNTPKSSQFSTPETHAHRVSHAHYISAASDSIRNQFKDSESKGKTTGSKTRATKAETLIHLVLWSSRVLRCDSTETGSHQPISSLLCGLSREPLVLWHTQHATHPAPNVWNKSRDATLEVISERDFISDFGAAREIRYLWRASKRQELVNLTITALIADGPRQAHVNALYQWFLPALAGQLSLPGLPLSIHATGHQGEWANIKLVDMGEIDADQDWDKIPNGYAPLKPRDEKVTLEKTPERDEQQWQDWIGVAKTALASMDMSARRLFSSGPLNESLKLEFAGTYLDAWLESLRQATGYLGQFSGRGFIFMTNDWPQQIFDNAPWPGNNQAPSILPIAAVRAGLILLSDEIDALNLANFAGDLDAAIAGNGDPAVRFRWETFMRVVDRANLRPTLLAFAANNPLTSINALGPNSNVLNLLACIAPLVQEFGANKPEVRSNLDFRLGSRWLSHYLPSVDISPDLPNSRTRGDAIVFFSSGNRDIRIELNASEIDITLNINLTDWEHTVDFGRRPLFDPFVFTDATVLRTFGALIPALSGLADIQAGYATTLRLKEATLDLDVDMEPELTVGSFLGALLCPPCIASLFAAGSASMAITDAALPAVIVVEQDGLGLDPPHLDALLGEASFGNVDVSVALFSLNPIVLFAANIVGNIIGDDVLEGILSSLIPGIRQPVQNLLASIPLPRASELIQAGSSHARAPTDPGAIIRSRTTGGSYLFEFAESNPAFLLSGGPLIFPAQGTALDSDAAVLMSHDYVMSSMSVVKSVRFGGPMQTPKPNGMVGDIDWWAEAPDQTNMPPKPAVTTQAPPQILLVPGSVGQQYWSYVAMIWVDAIGLAMRDLNASDPHNAIADLTFEAHVLAESVQFEVIMYEDCEDVSRFARDLAGGWEVGPQPGPAQRNPERVWVNGRAMLQPPRDGGAEGIDYGFGYEPEYTPLPDDPGPPPTPATMICKTIVTTDVSQREKWLEAKLRTTMPVHMGWRDQFSWANLPTDGLKFLPRFDFQLENANPNIDTLPFDIEAHGPLATLLLPANQAWLRRLMMDEILRACQRHSRIDPSQLLFQYGDSLVALLPENLLIGFNYRILDYTTFPGAMQSKNFAAKIGLTDPFRGRL